MTFATHRERQFMEYLLGKGLVKGTILPPGRLTDSLQQKGWIEQQAEGSKNQIFYRMTDVGLKALKATVPGRPSQQAKGRKKWTPEDDQHLLELKAAGTPLVIIAEKLDRTQASIDTRATKLKYQAKGK
jgi:DNA-binding PadR family transcriptional regulator